MTLRALLWMLCLAALGCGGTSSGYLPVDSPIMEFQPPEADELIEEEGDDDDDYDGDDELGGEEGAEDANAGTTPASDSSDQDAQ